MFLASMLDIVAQAEQAQRAAAAEAKQIAEVEAQRLAEQQRIKQVHCH